MNFFDLAKTVDDELLLSAVLKKPREFLVAHPKFNVTSAQTLKFRLLKQRSKMGEPLAYLLGYRWFFGSKFFVNKNVLIPRPETELLVAQALKLIKQNNIKYVFDIGTGSGAIAISIKKFAPAVKLVALDISETALKVAEINAKNNFEQKRINFLHSNLLQKIKTLPQNFLICANLPYLSKEELKEKTIRHEPKLALYGGTDATAKIIRLLEEIALKKKQSRGKILLEMNYNQAAQIKEWAKKILPNCTITVYKDLNNFNRLLLIAC